MELFKLFGTIAIQNQEALDALDDTVDKADESQNKIAEAFKKIGTAVASYFAADKIIDFGATCINAAADAQAMESQFSQVFGDFSTKAAESLTSIADQTGISENRLKGSFAQIASFAKTTGMETDDALSLAERSIIAVADSAAFYDRSIEDVTENLQSFLKGNYENDAALGLSCTETTRNAAANELYGKSFNELSEAQKQLTLLQMVEDANELSGAMGQASRESDTWTNQTGNLSQSWVDFTAMIGEKVLPAAVTLAGKMSEILTFFTEHEAAINNVAIVLGVLTTAIVAHNAALKLKAIGTAAAKTAEGAMAIMTGTSTIALGAHTVATNIATAASSAFGAVMAFITSPITIVIAAIAALVAIIVVCVKHWDEISAKVQEVWSNIKEWIGEAIDAVQGKLTEWKENISQKVAEIKESVVQKWLDIKNSIQNTWNGIKTNTKNAITNVKNTVINIFKSIVNKIKQVGKDIIEGLWNGINDKVDWIVEKVKGFAGSVLGAIKDFFGIHSPSRVMRDEVGKMLAEGLAEGIEDNTDAAETAAEEMSKTVLQAAKTRLDEYQTYNKLTLADEVAFWDSVRKQCAEGTAARLEADKNYISAKEDLDEQLAAAEKKYQDAIEETQKKIEDRTSSILTAFGLFKEYTEGDEIASETLMDNLESQVVALEDWQSALGTLEGKLGGTSLFETIQAMGVDALEEVRAINQMTDEELAAYVELYDKRAELARQIAEDELAEENAEAVRDAYQVYMETCNELGVSIIETTANMSENVATSFDEIAGAVIASMSKTAETIKENMTDAVTTVKESLETIKTSFAKFSPHMAMPHFSVSGAFGLNPTTVPTFDVDWYAKAMDNPMLMTDPTIFGYDAKSGNLLGGGEAGAEVVSGANTLMSMIRSAVSQQIGGLEQYLQRMIEILEASFPQVIDAMDFDIVFDADAAAGAMAVPMNKALGKLSAKKGRGR